MIDQDGFRLDGTKLIESVYTKQIPVVVWILVRSEQIRLVD